MKICPKCGGEMKAVTGMGNNHPVEYVCPNLECNIKDLYCPKCNTIMKKEVAGIGTFIYSCNNCGHRINTAEE